MAAFAKANVKKPVIGFIAGQTAPGDGVCIAGNGLVAECTGENIFVSRNGVIIGTAIITVVLSLSLIPLITTPLIWPVAILLSAAAFGVYVVGLAVLGDSFRGPNLIAGSAAFAAMWGIGGLAGPPIAGAAIDVFGGKWKAVILWWLQQRTWRFAELRRRASKLLLTTGHAQDGTKLLAELFREVGDRKSVV